MKNTHFFMALPGGEDNNFLHRFTTAEGRSADAPRYRKPDIDPGKTLGEMMDKGISPTGMTPTWSDGARKKYEACVSPHIESYRMAVDRINREAMKAYKTHNYAYISTSLGISSVTELYGAFRGDRAVRARWSWKTIPKQAGIGVSRQTFWIAFVVATAGYIYLRTEFLEAERIDFVSQTNYFFGKVEACRAANPYDMWRVLTPQEQYFEELKFAPGRIIHPPRRFADKLLDPVRSEWIFLPK